MKPASIKLVGMGYELGSMVSTNESLEKKFNLPAGFILEKTGIKERRYFATNEDPRELAASLAKRLLEKLNIHGPLPVFGSSNPYGTYEIPAPTMEIAHKAGFRNTPVFHINYGCGGYLAAIQAIHDYLAQRSDTTVLLILTDWPSSMVSQYETAVLFSDAVHVSIWSNSARYKGIEIEKIFYENNLENPYALNVQEKAWNMDGSAVAKFVRSVPGWIEKKMHISLKDFTIIPHQPNAKLLETLRQDYEVDFYDKDAREFGNTTCSAMLIALQNYLTHNTPNKPLLLMGFGDTESYGAMITKSIASLPLIES